MTSVLVVDDEKNILVTLSRALRVEGFDVDVVHDGNDGLWRAREFPYGAIVLDILLPGLLPLTREEDGALVAEVLWVDRYGNCQLNVDPDEVTAFGPRVQLRWGDDVRTAERAVTYEGIAPGQVGLVVDSYGMLSVCLGKRSAATELHLAAGTEVTLAPPTDDEAPPSSPVTLTTKART